MKSFFTNSDLYISRRVYKIDLSAYRRVGLWNDKNYYIDTLKKRDWPGIDGSVAPFIRWKYIALRSCKARKKE